MPDRQEIWRDIVQTIVSERDDLPAKLVVSVPGRGCRAAVCWPNGTKTIVDHTDYTHMTMSEGVSSLVEKLKKGYAADAPAGDPA